MSDDVWSERDTTPSRIEAALRDLLAARHRSNQAFVPARVINLVAIVDADFRGEIENRLERVGRYHPSRLILCAVHRGKRPLEAVATLSGDDLDGHQPGRFAVLRERIELEVSASHIAHLDTIVDPLVVSDVATVVWSPHGHREAVDSLAGLAQVVLIDSLGEDSVRDALCRAEELAGRHHVVDLSWLRSTPWRERTAAAFDSPQWRARLSQVSQVTVRHRHDSAAAASLFVGWLASRLGWRPELLAARGDALVGHARGRRQDVSIELSPIDQDAPGLAGVTIGVASGDSVSLDRAPGGLIARRSLRDGRELQFRVLGASRGEGGILGEGVRQALLRDRTYKPALVAARTMVAA